MSAWLPIAASLVGGAIQSWNTNKSLNAQAEENAQIRAYNAALAEKQNRWNLAQWQRENAYNSPSAQITRLRQAGLNPDMMYGGGVSGNISAHSPTMTSGAAATPMDWSSLANVNPVDKYLDAQFKQAQINKLNSETEGQGHQNDILASDAKFRDAFNQGQLDTMYSNIKVNDKGVELSDQQIKESQYRIMQINANVKEIDAKVKEIFNHIKNDNLRLDLDKAMNDAEIRKLASSCNLDYVQAKNIADQLTHVIDNLKEDYALKQQQKINIGHEGEILLSQSEEAKFNAVIRTFEGWDSDMNFYQNANKFLIQLLHGISGFIPGAKGLVR